MLFKQLATKEASLSYFFGCGTKGKSMAVEVVAGDEEWFIEEAKKANVTISYVIDTHMHVDHSSGGRKFAQMVGAPYCLHESDRGHVKFEFEPLSDGQSLNLGNVNVEVLHTPGHTPDSICLLVTDMRRGELPWFVVTGDTLFVGSVGRPDSPGRKHVMAAQLYDSIHNKLLHLSSEVEIFPGHQAGSVCGVGISGKPSSTIGFEKRWNPELTMNEEAFIKNLLKDIPPHSTGIDKLEVRVIAQAPPGGRCGLYTDYGQALAQHLGVQFKLEISTVRDTHGNGFPSIWINDSPLQPSDGVIVMPEDIVAVLVDEDIAVGEDLHAALAAQVDKLLNEGEAA